MMRKLSSLAKLLGRNFSSTTPILHERLFLKPIEITKNSASGSSGLVSGYGIDKFSQSKPLFNRDYAYGGLFQRQFCVTREAGEASVTNGCNSSNSAAELAKAPSPTTASEELIVKYKSQLKINPRQDFMIVYTCKVCETRSMKMASRESYEKGVVVVRCEGCDNLHLIADRLGWFGEPGSVENFLAARGEEFKKGSMDSLNLTVEDLAGEKMSNE